MKEIFKGFWEIICWCWNSTIDTIKYIFDFISEKINDLINKTA